MRIGWITNLNFHYLRNSLLDWLRPDMKMRFRPVAEWINKNASGFYNEIYNPLKKYDVVVFLKIMTDRAIAEAEKIRAYGGKVVFDANVNYYEIWGDYPVPRTRPTEEQQRQAKWMTRNADFVVADSTYIRDICLGISTNVSWVPDNVDTAVQYIGEKRHVEKEKLTLIWSGQAKKAFHFELIEECLYSYADRIKLLIVTNKEFAGNPLPDVIHRLRKKLECEMRLWDPERYPLDLLESDIIISPKILNNGYEMGHSEYKISLGMAQGLPAVASNQPSYINAFNGRKAGFICKTQDEWSEALDALLSSADLRQKMGDAARQCVVDRYSSEVVSRQYLDVFKNLVSEK